MLTEDVNVILNDAGRQSDVIAFMSDLYRRVDRRIGNIQNTCRACKRCCDFGVSGLNLFVTNVELAYFLACNGQIPEITGARCPFLDENAGCTARTARPIGCRTYFCEPGANYDQGLVYEEALSEVKAYIRDKNMSYFYMDWIRALKAIQQGE